MKTAISIPDDLFKDIDKLSKKLHCSRSQILTSAAREFIEKQKNRDIFDAINKAYTENETEQEVSLRRKSKKQYSKLLKEERW
ncbi:MAG: ribbon-helix-helix protein, CopG family [Candidatus Scalindua sp.]|nr:ribbon-helix-helix protein, CopG family [Candidatus Scalindua sp.]